MKAAHVSRTAINAELLLHGPCEPQWMLDPNVLQSKTELATYNLALEHSDFANNLLHLHLYLKANPPPNLLLLFVSPESMDEKYNAFDAYHFSFALEDSLVNQVVAQKDPIYQQWSYLPFMRYAYYNARTNFKVVQGIKHRIENRQYPKERNGFVLPVPRTEEVSAQMLMEKLDSIDFKWSTEREQDLIRLSHYTREKEIELILYMSPVYKGALPKRIGHVQMMERIDSLAHVHELTFWNFEHLEMASCSEYFFKAMNTKKAGSALFMDTLSRRLKEHVDEGP